MLGAQGGGGGVHGQVGVVFSTGDVQIIREHYGCNIAAFRRGLQKKRARVF